MMQNQPSGHVVVPSAADSAVPMPGLRRGWGVGDATTLLCSWVSGSPAPAARNQSRGSGVPATQVAVLIGQLARRGGTELSGHIPDRPATGQFELAATA